MDKLAADSAAFYESLHAHFDLVFSDVTDRDADYYRDVEGNPHTWWGPADFARENRYIAGFTRRTHTAVVLWQLPLGDTHENDTWNHYRDNRLQWWLGAGSAAHLRATAASGVIGLLFGAGASGNTTDMTDGGLFYRLAGRYNSDRCRCPGCSSFGHRLLAGFGSTVSGPFFSIATVGMRYWTGAPRPSQKLTNCASCGSEAVSTGRRCAQASATSPLVPGRRARITASPLAASPGVNAGAARRVNRVSPAGGVRVPYTITTFPSCSASSS